MIFDLSGTPGSEADDVTVPELSDSLQRDLFSAASSVLKLQPWKKLHDTEWFGIKDPDTGETHVIAIMGAARQVYAVHLYLPEEGIRFWNHVIRTGAPDMDMATRNLRMLSCEFVPENEDDMDDTDLDRNERFGEKNLAVGGLDSILLRSTLPGCINWHPDETEGGKLLDALRLLPQFLKGFKKLPQKTYEFEFGESFPLIPVYELKKNGDRANPADWELQLRQFPEAGPEPDFLPDELFPARLAAFKVKKKETWEFGAVHLDTPVACDGRPTWMTLTLAASQSSEMAFGSELNPLTLPMEIALRKSFLAAADQAGYVPATVCVASELAFKVFENLPGVTVRREGELPLFDKVIDHVVGETESLQTEDPLPEIPPEAAARIEEIMSRNPISEDMSAAEVAKMMAELSQVEGAEPLIRQFAAMINAETTSPPARPGPSKDRYIFRIELEGTDPPVWRRLSIAANSTFEDLHRALQALFDWDGDHLHCFQKRKGRRIDFSIGPDELDDFPDHLTPLSEIFKRKGSKIHYVYDFGDKWTHLVTQEGKVRAKKVETGPICLDGENSAPPEDCGGLWGFQALLDPESGYAEEYDFDPDWLKKIREGKFSPKDVKF